MLRHHHHSSMRIICYCLNREQEASRRPHSSHEEWSRDNMGFCSIVHPPDPTSSASDEDIARHMNSLRPHIIVDLHGLMYVICTRSHAHCDTHSCSYICSISRVHRLRFFHFMLCLSRFFHRIASVARASLILRHTYHTISWL
jgi:hypothetical protein